MYPRKKKVVFLVICFGLVFLVYSQTLFGDFVFDDRSLVEHSSFFKNPNNLFRVATMPYWTDEAGLYRPVTLISYALDYIFFGRGAWHFHLFNLIFYALTGYLLFRLIGKLFPEQKTLSYLAPLLFLVLPIHAEVAANIIGRAEIFALFFSTLAFLEAIKEKVHFWKLALWLFLAVGSKEVALAAWPILILIVFLKNSKIDPAKRRPYWLYLLALFLSGSVYSAVRFLVLGQYFLSNNATLVENPLKFVAFEQRIATALKILTFYLRKSFWPFGLCSDYSYDQIQILTGFFNTEAILGLIILLFFATGIIIFLDRAPLLALAFSFFLFAFLPVSNLILPIGTIAGERLVYFSSVGLCLFLAAGLLYLRRLNPRKFFRLASFFLTLAIICFYAGISFIRSFDWLTEKRLFLSAAKCAPNSVLSRSNLGTLYYFDGQYDRAEEEFLKANQIYDRYSKAVNNLGLVYWKKGEYQKAKEQYFKAIKNWPPYSGVYENLALLEISQGKIERAKHWLTLGFGSRKAAEIFLRNYGVR